MVAEAPAPAPKSAGAIFDRAAFAAAAAALMAGGPHARVLQRGWRETGGRVVFEHRGPHGRIAVSTSAPDAAAAWADVEEFSALTLDALLAVDLAARVDAETVLQAKAYGRCGDERRAFRAQVDAELDRLRRLRLQIEGATEIRTLADFLRPVPAAVSPRRPPDGPLRFDHRSNRGADVLAKKLAVWLSLQEDAEARKARQVRAVLAAIGELPVHIGERGARSGRLADRFDEALMRLEEAGLSRLRYRGESACAGDRSRGWITRWLRQTVVIEPQPGMAAPQTPLRRSVLS
ncbi:hypothetical protein [Caulobacter sp. 17J80-11]|uniref:hypothetical protein n=1 Tax=Caulobacter sp. 17J80-11 TaxID=2763502 RepID=UPI001653E360|nr:hypothetical protein [Caulobacter sp. 17J80-11]MBC6982426.1 hypothetical protein [Caulobacter sp. 17J80-11]